jgi:thioester reductase-like protein
MTGAASLVGAEVLRELLRRRDVESVCLLMPADGAKTMARVVGYLGAMPQSVTMVPCDLRLPRFGLSSRSWEELASSFDLGIHCAQREVPDQNAELARAANLQPVENWIDLLDCNPELRLHHLSTAFIGGTRRGLLTEFDLDCGQQFHNAWERSKFEAEVALRQSAAGDRVTIYRPSHTLVCSTGDSFELGGSFPLLAMLSTASILPGDGRARIDFVPADYVASAMVALACADAAGTFHLACGWENSLPVRTAAALAAKAWGRSRGPRMLPRAMAWPLRLGSGSLAFTTARDLLHQGPVFDTFLSDRALQPLGISRPAPESWLANAVRRVAR